MEKSLLFSAGLASAILFLCAISVRGAPADSGGTSAAEAEREAWRKIKQQTADFLAHEREYVQSQRNPLLGVPSVDQPIAVEKSVAAVNAAPVAAAPDSAATTLPPVTTPAATDGSSTVGVSVAANATAAVGITTTPVPSTTAQAA